MTRKSSSSVSGLQRAWISSIIVSIDSTSSGLAVLSLRTEQTPAPPRRARHACEMSEWRRAPTQRLARARTCSSGP